MQQSQQETVVVRAICKTDSRSNHGKTLVQIDLAEISHSPLSRVPQAQAGHQVVTDLTQKIETMQAELIEMEAIASGHRADFEREYERTNKLLAELLKASSETMTCRRLVGLACGRASIMHSTSTIRMSGEVAPSV